MKMTFHFVIFLTSFLYRAINANNGKNGQKFYLPPNLEPKLYNLLLNLHLDDVHYYWGNVIITVKCVAETKQIVVNIKDLSIVKENVRIKFISENVEVSGTELEHSYDEEADQYIITLNQSLKSDHEYEIYIPFTKYYKQGFSGLIEYTYTKGIGTIPKTLLPDWIKDEFEESKPVPTYSIALALLTGFEMLEQPNESPSFIHVWADPSVINRLSLTYTVAFQILDFLAKCFKLNTQHALPKLDILILPYLDGGVEENYGIVFLSEKLILQTPKPADESNEFEKICKLCGALIKQWLGFTVSMTGWNEYWLQEGFIRFFQSTCAKKHSETIPELRGISDLNLLTSFFNVLTSDIEKTSDPVFVAELDLDLTERSLTEEIYSKSHHLVRMLHFFLGSEVFQESVIWYMNEFQFSNSNVGQVWEYFSNGANKKVVLTNDLTIDKIMSPWIRKKGYPLIRVTRHYDEKTVELVQKRFTSLQEENETNDENVCWNIPLSYTTMAELRFEDIKVNDWLTCDTPLVLDVDVDENQWILFNLKFNVISRTHYDIDNWNLLKAYLLDSEQYHQIDVMTRARLISDMFALTEAGILTYDILFHTLKYLTHEKSYIPLKTAFDQLFRIRTLFFGTETLHLFEEYIRKIVEPIFQENENQDFKRLFDGDNEKHRKKLLIIESSCTFGIIACQIKAQELFNEWYFNYKWNQPNPIPRSIRRTIYCQAIKLGDEKLWNWLHYRYFEGKEPHVNDEILESLSCTENTELLKKHLERSINHRKIFEEESLTVFNSLSSNENGYKIMKGFVTKNITRITYFHKNNNNAIISYFLKILDITAKSDDLKNLTNFIDFTSKRVDITTEQLKKSINRAKKNVLWLKTYEEKLAQLFQNINAEV